MMVVATCAARPATARPIEVRTATSLSLDVQVSGTVVQARLALRDNVAQGLGYRPLTLTVACDGDAPSERTLQSDRAGAASASVVVPQGGCIATARYAGDRFHDGAGASAEFVAALMPLELVVDAPRVALGDGWTASLRVAGASGDAVADVQGAEFRAPCLRADAVGAGLWEIARADTQAECGWQVTVAANDEHTAASVGGVIRTAHEPRIVAFVERESTPPFAAPRWRIRGVVSDDVGPVAGAAVVVTVDGVELAELRTDGSGAWETSATLERAAAGTHMVRASFVPDAPTGAAATVINTGFTVARSPTDWVPLMTLMALALALGAILAVRVLGAWQARRNRRDDARRPGAHETNDTFDVPGFERRDALMRLVLRDVDTGWPLVGTVEVSAPSIGVVSSATDASGVVYVPRSGDGETLRVVAEVVGYLRLDSRATAPRPGRSLAVKLVSVRSQVRRVLEALVRDLALSESLPERWWGRTTTHEVRDILASRLRRLRHAGTQEPVARRELERLIVEAGRRRARAPAVEAAEALALFVDDVVFGGRAWGADAVAIAEQLAAAVRTAMAEGE